MKKVILFINIILFTFILSGCGISFPKLEDYKLFIDDYYSIFIKNEQTSVFYIKGVDSDQKNSLIMANTRDKEYTYQSRAYCVVLPEEIIDFTMCGLYDNGQSATLLLSTNDGCYINDRRAKGWFTRDNIIKVNYTFKNNTRNFAYHSAKNKMTKTNSEYMFNEDIGEYQIDTDELNNSYFQNDEEQILLVKNTEVINSFFMIGHCDDEYDYYPIMIVSTYSTYYFLINEEMEIIYQKEFNFQKEIMDYNYCSLLYYRNGSGTHLYYFYIISDNKLYLYDKQGNEISIIEIDGKLLNTNIYIEKDLYTEEKKLVLNLIYKADERDIIFKIERKEFN